MRAFSVPSSERPVGITAVAKVRRMSSSLATIRRAPEVGRLVVSFDQNVTAVALGSPDATPLRKLPGPTPARVLRMRFAQAGGTAAKAAPAAVAPISSRRVEGRMGIAQTSLALSVLFTVTRSPVLPRALIASR